MLQLVTFCFVTFIRTILYNEKCPDHSGRACPQAKRLLLSMRRGKSCLPPPWKGGGAHVRYVGSADSTAYSDRCDHSIIS